VLLGNEQHPFSFGGQAVSELRVDKWVWFCRFYKSRSQATEAVGGGLVHVNGERVKASRGVRAGDMVSITHDEIRIVAEVLGLPVRRGPAAEAQTFYRETEESAAARQKVREARRLAPPAPDSRPDKHDRRLLRRLRQK
jgi:ribosome-associated heat shock protein Hsp15